MNLSTISAEVAEPGLRRTPGKLSPKACSPKGSLSSNLNLGVSEGNDEVRDWSPKRAPSNLNLGEPVARFTRYPTGGLATPNKLLSSASGYGLAPKNLENIRSIWKSISPIGVKTSRMIAAATDAATMRFQRYFIALCSLDGKVTPHS